MDTEKAEEVTSLADDLAAAWDKDDTVIKEADDADTGSGEPESGSSDTGGLQVEGSETGQAGDSDKPDAGGPDDSGGVQVGEETRNVAEDGAASAGAPVSWNATARETWKDIPKAAQTYIEQREREMEAGIKKYATNAHRASQMDQVLEPYSQYFAMNGGAGPTMKNLLARGATLQMGTPVQKAQMVADMISQYSIDIGALDDLLVGKTPGGNVQQTSEVQQAVATAMQPFQQYIGGVQQREQQAQQQQQQQIGSDVEAFASDPKNEFYKDVSNDMADILDMASNRGMEMSMAQAYERACSLNPEVSKILTNRTAAANAANKRRAGTSITGSPGGDGGPAVVGSMRESLEQAWDNAGQV